MLKSIAGFCIYSEPKHTQVLQKKKITYLCRRLKNLSEIQGGIRKT